MAFGTGIDRRLGFHGAEWAWSCLGCDTQEALASSLNDSGTLADMAQLNDTPHSDQKPVVEHQPGVASMPKWTVGELPEAPVFEWKKIAAFIGPGMVMAAAAIGGGEWLTGPTNTARYGAAIFWLATLSIFAQSIYNVEICRYTLYTGEPIFTGKFRIAPGPWFWVVVYLILDFGSFLPYLASNAAIPLAAMILRRMPDPKSDVVHILGMTDSTFLKFLSLVIFVGVFIPLLFGGKIYNSMKALMTFKLFAVFGFLLFLAVMFSTAQTWKEIGSGFFKFGTVPVIAEGDTNSNGKHDAGEPVHGPNLDNAITAWWQGRTLAPIDYSLLGFLAAMAALAGNGGLTNTPVSNYTRDQGWGMGSHVGAIPSIVGGHEITLSHEGCVFKVTEEAIPRWKRWLYHVRREQWFLWAPACFVGLALPSMLSIQFLQKGTVPSDKWLVAGMTAQGVADAVGARFGASLGDLFWHLTLFCGFLVLATSMASTADGVLRRWVDVFWTASPRLRKWDTKDIGKLYFGVLVVYLFMGMGMLCFLKGDALLVFSTMMYNYALGFSCIHALVVNTTLMPVALRPGWIPRLGLVFGGFFFTTIALITTWSEWSKIVAIWRDAVALFQ